MRSAFVYDQLGAWGVDGTGYNHTAGERLPGRGATSLAVKSVKALSPHFFLWRESEPIGRWAISGISCSEEAEREITHCLSMALTFTRERVP